jgi:hypothetical protein
LNKKGATSAPFFDRMIFLSHYLFIALSQLARLAVALVADLIQNGDKVIARDESIQ